MGVGRSSLRVALPAVAAVLVALAAPGTSAASSHIRFGVDDDQIVGAGPAGDSAPDTLDTLGVRLVRYTVNWRRVAPRKPEKPLDPRDPAYDWGSVDQALRRLHKRGIVALVTLWGTPAWANDGKPPNVLPKNRYSLAAFAGAVSARYPWIRLWEVWNEPNQQVFMSPNSPRLYVQRLLNPVYVELHLRNRANRVAGGATSPRPTQSALSPVAFMRGMRAAHARLDAYSHHPYPISHGERPFGFAPGVCRYCKGILTLANLPELIKEVRRDFGPKRIWLTEYGYQTNPPDTFLGVPLKRQATMLSLAAMRAWRLPRVTMFFQYLYRDEPELSRFQSGLVFADDHWKPSLQAFRLPFAQMGREADRAIVWGQIRNGRPGRKAYRLEVLQKNAWKPIRPIRLTNDDGVFIRKIRLKRGALLRVWSPSQRRFSLQLRIR